MSYLDLAKQSLDSLRKQSTDEQVTSEFRRKTVATMIERVNAAYSGGVIDWPRLDAIEHRIESAQTSGELAEAVAEYEALANNQKHAGQLGQQGV